MVVDVEEEVVEREDLVARSPHGVTEFLTPSHFVYLIAHSTGILK
jgi:hypothetical protein